MTRAELEKYINEIYSCEGDCPWQDKPNYKIFRHGSNKKWFAAVFDVPKIKLGLKGEENLDIANLKCDPVFLGSLLLKEGFFPAYHMNKANWITVALDGSADDETIKFLLDMSFELTAVKVKK